MRDRVSRSAFPLLLLAVAFALTAGALSTADAAVTSYVVQLDGASESPPVSSSGIGAGQVDIDPVAHTMRIQVTFSGLTGNTTASHIHAPTTVPLTGTAGVATQTPSFTGFPLGVQSGTMDQTFNTLDLATYRAAFVTAAGGTAAQAEAVLFQAIADGKAYLNIHSTTNAGGEIRGFLLPAGATQSPATTWGKIKALYR